MEYSAVRTPVFASRIPLPHQMPALLPKVKPLLLIGTAEGSGQTPWGPSSVVCVLLVGEHVNLDGTSKQNQGEAMWALHSNRSQDQWIRLI